MHTARVQGSWARVSWKDHVGHHPCPFAAQRVTAEAEDQRCPSRAVRRAGQGRSGPSHEEAGLHAEDGRWGSESGPTSPDPVTCARRRAASSWDRLASQL